MRKTIFLFLLTGILSTAFSQDFCVDDVVENLEANIDFAQLQVDFTWDFNDPVSCGVIVCPPYPVSYQIEVQFGINQLGPSGPTNWFMTNSYNYWQLNIDFVHNYSVPITSKFEYVRFRVKVDGCSNWDGWVTTSIWD